MNPLRPLLLFAVGTALAFHACFGAGLLKEPLLILTNGELIQGKVISWNNDQKLEIKIRFGSIRTVEETSIERIVWDPKIASALALKPRVFSVTNTWLKALFFSSGSIFLSWGCILTAMSQVDVKNASDSYQKYASTRNNFDNLWSSYQAQQNLAFYNLQGGLILAGVGLIELLVGILLPDRAEIKKPALILSLSSQLTRGLSLSTSF